MSFGTIGFSTLAQRVLVLTRYCSTAYWPLGRVASDFGTLVSPHIIDL